LALDPDNAEALTNRGVALSALKRYAEALVGHEHATHRALAKLVWVLLPFVPDWRWLLDRDDSPMRLFRQDESRMWDNVVARVGATLRDQFVG
jgi:hypothetical protein